MSVSTSSLLDPKLIREHSGLVHDFALRFPEPGKLVIAAFGEDPCREDPKTKKPGLKLPPRIIHSGLADVDLTAKAIRELGELPHYNVYMPLVVFRPDLPHGSKGSEKDVLVCSGLVADFDDPDAARWAERLPLEPQYVLETSQGRFQCFYLFSKPVPLEAVKPVAERLKAFAQCDHGTSDISHVWRVPGTLNWPNGKKVAEGRSPAPQLVKVVQPFDGRIIRLEALAEALPESAQARSDKTQQEAPAASSNAGKRHLRSAAVEGTLEWQCAQLDMMFLSEEVQEEIRRPAEGDRSKALFRMIAKLIEQGLSDETMERLIYAHPKGIGEKYANRDDLDKEIARIRQKLLDPLAPLIEEMNEQYAVVDDNGKTRVVYRVEDREMGRKYVVTSSFADFRNLHLNEQVPVTDGSGKSKMVTKAQAWLPHPDRRTYKAGMRFLPGVTEPPEGIYNLWSGWGVEPRPGDWSLMKEHIRNVICSGVEEHFQHLMNWLAWAVQEPGTAGEVAIVIRGKRGTGKGVFARAFGSLFGQHFLHLSDARHLTGNFNAHLRDACVVFADEAFYAGDKQHEGQLKRLVTEPTLIIEPKGRDVLKARNTLHVIVASNEDWAVPAGADERRFFVLDASPSRQKDFTYFEAIENQLRDGGASAMLYELQHRDLSGFNVRDVPATAALLDQKTQTFRGMEAWWYDILVQGIFPAAGLQILGPDEYQDWTQPVSARRDELYANYVEFSRSQKEFRPKIKAEFGKMLRTLVPGLGEKRPREQGIERSRLYTFPALHECRRAFDAYVGQSTDWERN
jgi:hypothetical protein